MMSRTYHHGYRAKKKLFGHGGHHWLRSPGWWIHDFMTRPQRAEVRRLTRVVMRLSDLDDAPEFPLAKKPHIYYW